MRTHFKSFVLLLGIVLFGFSHVYADLEVSADVRVSAVAEFQAPLTPLGSWVEVRDYGRCWHPARVAADWRPYCEGEWVWTDCGWYWQSDEPWSWACYHYGSWALDPTYGWVWVPGVEWAPAWVSWRVGGGYCGWAPLGPRGIVLAPAAFVFVDEHRFHERLHRSSVVINNTTIIQHTTVINNSRRETRNIAGLGSRRVVINEGPGVDRIARATGHRFDAAPIHEVARRTEAPREVVRTPTPAVRAPEPERRIERGRNEQEERSVVREARPEVPAVKPAVPETRPEVRREQVESGRNLPQVRREQGQPRGVPVEREERRVRDGRDASPWSPPTIPKQGHYGRGGR